MAARVQNELNIKTQGAAALNPFNQHDSSPRLVMLSQHLGQSLQTAGADIRRIQTGAEREFGKGTFSKKFPVNAHIIKIIKRYPATIGADSINENPQEIVIYEDCDTPLRVVGIMSLERFNCLHQHFGFRYKSTGARQKLYHGANIPKGTIVADSPAIDEQGNYRYGVETNVAYMSVPGVIEDGVIVSEDYIKRITAKGYEVVTESWGKNHHPVNLYGDPNDPTDFKAFPDIGSVVRDDGQIFALRRYDDILAPIEMSPEALREPDYIYDKATFVKPGARVIDVKVYHNRNNRYPPTPVGMTAQVEKYHNAMSLYYRNLLDTYNELKRNRGDKLRITREFQALLVEALGYLPQPDNAKVTLTHRRVPVDDWRVVITYEYDEVPTVGNKLTGLHGNKGVICAIWKTEDMPIDAQGNRAEIIMDGDSIIKRMNIGCLYEPYYNAASRDVSKHVRQLFGLGAWAHEIPANVTPFLSAPLVEEAWQYLLGYYQIVAPKMVDLLTGPNYRGTPRSHVEAVIRDGVYLWMPPDNPIDSVEAVSEVRIKYPPHMGPVTYRGRSGNVVTTTTPVLIGSVYIIILEKTGGDFSGVSSAKLQHFGIPAKLTKFDARSAPVRGQPVRVFGETEVRLISATAGSAVVADILDQSNNPTVHKEIVANIYRAPRPTDIEEVVDRAKFPSGNGRNLVFIRHIMETAGCRFVYEPESRVA